VGDDHDAATVYRCPAGLWPSGRGRRRWWRPCAEVGGIDTNADVPKPSPYVAIRKRMPVVKGGRQCGDCSWFCSLSVPAISQIWVAEISYTLDSSLTKLHIQGGAILP